MSTDIHHALEFRAADGYDPCPRCGSANIALRPQEGTLLEGCAWLPCVLTTHNFTQLHRYGRDHLDVDDPLREALLVKLAHARLVSPAGIGDDIATLESRLTFVVDGRTRETRVLVKPGTALTVGRDLPALSPLGLALLGLSTGQKSVAFDHLGIRVPITLVGVNYQPEAADRKRSRAYQS
jgi:regulator of nucleoside diphosphate kinase